MQRFGEGIEIVGARNDSVRSGDFGCAQQFGKGMEILAARSDAVLVRVVADCLRSTRGVYLFVFSAWASTALGSLLNFL